MLRLQQLYQTMQPGKTAFKITIVNRIYNATDAIDFLLALEQFDRWSNKRIVLDCNAKNAKSILVEHVRKVQLGRRTYHYMLSGLVSFWNQSDTDIYVDVSFMASRFIPHKARCMVETWGLSVKTLRSSVSVEFPDRFVLSVETQRRALRRYQKD